jgi:hypothetical protein
MCCKFAVASIASRPFAFISDVTTQSFAFGCCSIVVTCFDPEKLFPDGRLDYLRENRTRERQYDCEFFAPLILIYTHNLKYLY